MTDSEARQKLRFQCACRMLRLAGHLDSPLPEQKPGESPIDWLVRFNLAPNARTAAEMLIIGRGLEKTLDEVIDLVATSPAPHDK